MRATVLTFTPKPSPLRICEVSEPMECCTDDTNAAKGIVCALCICGVVYALALAIWWWR